MPFYAWSLPLSFAALYLMVRVVPLDQLIVAANEMYLRQFVKAMRISFALLFVGLPNSALMDLLFTTPWNGLSILFRVAAIVGFVGLVPCCLYVYYHARKLGVSLHPVKGEDL